MASEISWFHLPKILFSSFQLKLIGTAQRWAQQRWEAYEIAKLIVHSIVTIGAEIFPLNGTQGEVGVSLKLLFFLQFSL